jgi:hypothetical protein
MIFPFVSFPTTFPHATRKATGYQPQNLRNNQIGSAISIHTNIEIARLREPDDVHQSQHNLDAGGTQIHQYLGTRQGTEALLEKAKDEQNSAEAEGQNGADTSALKRLVLNGLVFKIRNGVTLSKAAIGRVIPLEQS